MNTRQVISNYVTEELARDLHGTELHDDHDLVAHGILDSLGILTLVSFLEQEFGFVVGDDEVVPENFATVASIEAFVNAKRERMAS